MLLIKYKFLTPIQILGFYGNYLSFEFPPPREILVSLGYASMVFSVSVCDVQRE